MRGDYFLLGVKVDRTNNSFEIALERIGISSNSDRLVSATEQHRITTNVSAEITRQA